MRSWTSSRLSARCVHRGTNPAIEAMASSVVSSAVSRELTIQSASAYGAARRVTRRRRQGRRRPGRRGASARSTAASRRCRGRTLVARGCSRRSARGRSRRRRAAPSASGGSCSRIGSSTADASSASAATTGTSERRIAVANPATRTTPAGSAAGSRSSAGGLDRGEDRDRVVGEPLTGGCQPHPPARRLDQRRPRLASQDRELLRDRRGRVPELVGDRAHRAAPGELEQQPQAARIHRSIVISERSVRISSVDMNGRRADNVT